VTKSSHTTVSSVKIEAISVEGSGRDDDSAGRFHVEDLSLTMAVVGRALLGLGQLLHDEPDRDDAEAADLSVAAA
jgi:hypothetical protein